MVLAAIAKAIFGSANDRQVKKYLPRVAAINGNDALCPMEPCCLLSHKSYRSAAKDDYRIPGLHFTPFYSTPTGGKDVSQKQYLLVGKLFRN